MIRIDESEIRGHLDEMVRGTVEETVNELLDAEADAMCKAQRYERSSDRVDTRAGHYKRKLTYQGQRGRDQDAQAAAPDVRNGHH